MTTPTTPTSINDKLNNKHANLNNTIDATIKSYESKMDTIENTLKAASSLLDDEIEPLLQTIRPHLEYLNDTYIDLDEYEKMNEVRAILINIRKLIGPPKEPTITP